MVISTSALNDPEALKDYIADKRETGTYLSVLGFGRGNLDDATMQALAQNGNGQAAYIDTLSEARKVLGRPVDRRAVPDCGATSRCRSSSIRPRSPNTG